MGAVTVSYPVGNVLLMNDNYTKQVMALIDDIARVPKAMRRKCDECGRIFNLLDEDDSNEWMYGHDCEA